MEPLCTQIPFQLRITSGARAKQKNSTAKCNFFSFFFQSLLRLHSLGYTLHILPLPLLLLLLVFLVQLRVQYERQWANQYLKKKEKNCARSVVGSIAVHHVVPCLRADRWCVSVCRCVTRARCIRICVILTPKRKFPFFFYMLQRRQQPTTQKRSSTKSSLLHRWASRERVSSPIYFIRISCVLLLLLLLILVSSVVCMWYLWMATSTFGIYAKLFSVASRTRALEIDAESEKEWERVRVSCYV